jgi:hypothetical protein
LNVSDSKFFLRLTITIENTGEVLIAPNLLKVGIQQIVPWPKEILDRDALSKEPLNKSNTEFDFEYIVQNELTYGNGEFVIEPHEWDETHVDFVLPVSIKTITCYSYTRNDSKIFWCIKRKKEIGWHMTTIHDLKPTAAAN